MQKVALISDVHANYIAFERVLSLIDDLGIEMICCLGDTVSYGPQPAACIEALRERGVVSVMGNHDAAVAGEVELGRFPKSIQRVLLWTREVLSEEERGYLAELPYLRRKPWGRLIHGSPHDALWHYVSEADTAFYIFRLVSDSFIFVGHTHRPLIFSTTGLQVRTRPVRVKKGEEDYYSLRFELDDERRYLINPGSVGQPRDGDPRASFAVLKIEDQRPVTVTWYRIKYDIENVENMIVSRGLPSKFGARLARGK